MAPEGVSMPHPLLPDDVVALLSFRSTTELRLTAASGPVIVSEFHYYSILHEYYSDPIFQFDAQNNPGLGNRVEWN